MTDEPTVNNDGRPPEICFELLRLWRNGRRLNETNLHLASQAAGWLRGARSRVDAPDPARSDASRNLFRGQRIDRD